MPRIKTEHAVEDGWTRWVSPIPKGYRMACCDCGLVHDMEFEVLKVVKKDPDGTWDGRPMSDEKYRVNFRVKRNNRSTAKMRKSKKHKPTPPHETTTHSPIFLT